VRFQQKGMNANWFGSLDEARRKCENDGSTINDRRRSRIDEQAPREFHSVLASRASRLMTETLMSQPSWSRFGGMCMTTASCETPGCD
jgi:hypothetical protein